MNDSHILHHVMLSLASCVQGDGHHCPVQPWCSQCSQHSAGSQTTERSLCWPVPAGLTEQWAPPSGYYKLYYVLTIHLKCILWYIICNVAHCLDTTRFSRGPRSSCSQDGRVRCPSVRPSPWTRSTEDQGPGTLPLPRGLAGPSEDRHCYHRTSRPAAPQWSM